MSRLRAARTSPARPAELPWKNCPLANYRDSIPTVALLSFRLGGSDGVAIEAEKWAESFRRLGFTTYTVAGTGPVDRTVPSLAIDATHPPEISELVSALEPADLVVVENLCSLPLNPGAASAVATVLAGRPAILHHHDLPWQRTRFAGYPPPPDDRRWTHVTINRLSERELAGYAITSTTVYNSFDTTRPAAQLHAASRSLLRSALGLGSRDRLVMQPTRALARKNIGGGIHTAEALGATYWLLGPAEDGYGAELDRQAARARCPVMLGWPAVLGWPGDGIIPDISAAYAACDLVVLPSTWEGFGNPSVESAIYRRPLVIGPYPVAAELAAFGFRWFDLASTSLLDRWLDAPDPALLNHNWEVADRYFSLADLPDRIERVLPEI